MNVEQRHTAASEEYKKNYSTGEYCHEQSFLWGFQEGVDYMESAGKSLLDNAKELYNSIEEFTTKLIQARLHKDLKAEEYVIFQRETLLCRVQQYLSNIIDYYDNRNEVQHRG